MIGETDGREVMRLRRPFVAPVRRRIAIIFLFSVALLAVIWLRLGYLQIVRHGFFESQALSQRFRGEEVVPHRGGIYDRNEVPLAVTEHGPGVYAVPASVRDVEATAKVLAGLLDEEEATLAARLSRNSSLVWLAARVDDATATAIEQLELPGVYVAIRPRRGYPNGSLAADVLGYTGIDNQGLAALEHTYDEALSGVPGIHLGERDPRGRIIASAPSELIVPVPGDDLILTIDYVLQHAAEQELAKGIAAARAAWGLAILLDPHTGEIFALTVLPTFDPANYERYLPRAHRNPAVADQFEPGSTLKIITAAAALEEGLAQPDTMLAGPPSLHIGGGVVHCHTPFGHDELTLNEAIAVSCNTALAALGAQTVGGPTLARYLQAFGFGNRLGVDLPGESGGIVPAVGRVDGELLRWANVSFGQGIAVTPLQMAAATAVIANGGTLMQPHIVRGVRDAATGDVETRPPVVLRQVISEATSRDVTEAMAAAVSRGTGTRAQVPGYTVAGKTGTAQIPEGGTYGDKRLASFVGFAPADDPRLVGLIMLYDVQQDTAEGGRWAAPVFAEIMRRALPHLGVPPEN